MGFKKNPYNYLSGSALFVLSSRWDGFGIILAETMVSGIPVISTDYPQGPREILKYGNLGELVTKEDPMALSQTMLSALRNTVDRDILKDSAERCRDSQVARSYMNLFGI